MRRCNTVGLVTANRVPRLQHWCVNRDGLRTRHVVATQTTHNFFPPKVSTLVVRLYSCMICIINVIFALLGCYAV